MLRLPFLIACLIGAGVALSDSGPSSASPPDVAARDASSPIGLDGSGLQAGVATGRRCTGRGARPAVLCVDARVTAGGDGSAARPFVAIQDAVDAARSGDTIQVAGGMYRERVRIAGKRLTLLGGFSGSVAGLFVAKRSPAATPSVIRGPGKGTTLELVQAGASVIDGFRITRGTGHLEGTGETCCAHGGGVFISEGAPRLSHNLIDRNDLTTLNPKYAHETAGGGIFSENANTSLIANVIRKNRAGHGAVAVNGGKVLIQDNLIENNVAVGDHGGGLYLSSPELRVIGNRIRGNRVEPYNGEGGWGGGLIAFDARTVIWLEGNEVRENSAPDSGGGEFIDDGARATIRNEIIAANRCGRRGSGLYVDGLDSKVRSSATLSNVTIAGHRCPGMGQGVYVENANVMIENSILWQNGGDDFHREGVARLAVRYTLSEEKVQGPGNIQRDPLFVSLPNDLHLRSTAGRWQPTAGLDQGTWVQDSQSSPAIDAADPSQPVDNEPPPNGARRNLGAYGGTARASRSE